MNAQLSRPVDNDEGGRIAFYPSITIKPSSSTSLSLSPSFDHDRTAQQFVTSFSDPDVQPGFGGMRYVFGRLEQKTFAIDTRLNATFTPTLTLQLFAQPFLASGHYTSFKEFAKPRSSSMIRYGKDNGSSITKSTTIEGQTIYTVDPDGTGAASPFVVDNPDFNVRSLRGTAVMRVPPRLDAVLRVDAGPRRVRSVRRL
jgi:hypothetical protein